MKLRRTPVVATALLAVAIAAGCAQISDGRPVADAGVDFPAPAGVSPSSANAQPEPGIAETRRVPVPPGAVTCAPDPAPPVGFVAAVDDARAPQIVIAVPEGWTFTRGTDGMAATLNGPRGMSASVTIEPTELAPQQAFRAYTDAVMAKSSISTVSILPAELCGYSSQKMTGTWSDTPAGSVEFADRVAHVWTNTGTFLVAVHVQAPAGVDELEAASGVLTGDFEVRIP